MSRRSQAPADHATTLGRRIATHTAAVTNVVADTRHRFPETTAKSG